MSARRRRPILTDRQAIDMAVPMVGAGSSLEEYLRRSGVSQADIVRVMRAAEAEYVNGPLRLMAPPQQENSQ